MAMQLLHESASLNAELVPMVAESDGAVVFGYQELDHAYAETPPQVLYDEVLGCLDTISVQVGDDFRVVVADTAQKKTKCVACAQPYSCIHSQSVEKNLCDTTDDLLLQFLCALNRGTVTAEIKHSTAISTQNIPFQCASGLQWKKSPLVASSIGHYSNGRHTTQKHVFGLQSIDLCPVTTLVCTDCGRTKEYDGGDDMMVHMDKYLVTHQVMREYFRGFVSEGTTIYSYFKMWQWRLLDSGCQGAAKLSYVQFRDACDRVFVKDAGCRELLCRFCSDKLDRESMDRLRVLLPKHQPALLPFMEEVIEQGQITCPRTIKRLLLALVSNAPVCALIPNNPELHRVIQRIVRVDNISQSASTMEVLHLHCPLLHQVYIQGLNSSFLPVLECAIAISQKTFERGVSQ